MPTQTHKDRASWTLPALALEMVLGGTIASCVGALCLGLGVYFASYSDRLVPFAQAGALAGFIAAATYTLLGRRGANDSARLRPRPILAALVSTLVLCGQLILSLAMPLTETLKVGMLWFSTAGILLILIGRSRAPLASDVEG